jgi:chaperonin GroEL (HSP60 family)
MKERLDRVDDALKTAGIAKESGVVPGGGLALFDSIPDLKILTNAISIPKSIIKPWGDSDDFVKDGIVDPAKTIVSALENAASVVKMIICTDYFLVKMPLEGE